MNYYLIILTFLISLPAQAIEIVVNEGYAGAQPIMIVPFENTDKLGDSPHQVIGDDLELTGEFKVVDKSKLPGSPHRAQDMDFEAFGTLGATYAIVGSVHNNSLQVELINVLEKTSLAEYKVELRNTQGKTIRAASHSIADLIYEYITDTKGVFSTKIAYIAVHKDEAGTESYSLELTDITGKDTAVVLRSNSPLMSPSWSPSGKFLAYVSFEKGRPEVWAQNLTTGQRGRLAAFEGNNSAPAWSPDGEKVALSLSKDGNPEIYILYIENGDVVRFSVNEAAETEPAWGPNSRMLYFLSDRSGTPQIHRADIQERRAEQVTLDGSYNTSPDISPDGEHMVFLHRTEGNYQVAHMDLESRATTVISQTNHDESPSFAPNSNMVVYGSRDDDGREILVITNQEGTAFRKITFSDKNIRDPVWGPWM
jgi:TolB protein